MMTISAAGVHAFPRALVPSREFTQWPQIYGRKQGEFTQRHEVTKGACLL
jgi:hypothetical protein